MGDMVPASPATFDVTLGWEGGIDIEIKVSNVYVQYPVYVDGKPYAIGNYVVPAIDALRERGVRVSREMEDDVHWAIAKEVNHV